MKDIRILIIDDDAHICELLQLYLVNAGFVTEMRNDAATGLELLQKESFDLVLLDVMLPDMPGFAACEKIKAFKDIPVIMITARDMLQDKIQGFNSGADDYIVKPFEPAEVIARINARLRQKKPAQPEPEDGVITLYNITLDINRYEVKKAGKTVDLKPKELQLLYFLLCNKNIVFSRDTLLQRVWNYEFSGDTRTVDVHIKTLRQKLIHPHSKWQIKTVWGIGYKLEVSDV